MKKLLIILLLMSISSYAYAGSYMPHPTQYKTEVCINNVTKACALTFGSPENRQAGFDKPGYDACVWKGYDECRCEYDYHTERNQTACEDL